MKHLDTAFHSVIIIAIVYLAGQGYGLKSVVGAYAFSVCFSILFLVWGSKNLLDADKLQKILEDQLPFSRSLPPSLQESFVLFSIGLISLVWPVLWLAGIRDLFARD